MVEAEDKSNDTGDENPNKGENIHENEQQANEEYDLFAAVEKELQGVGATELDIPLTRSEESEKLSHAYDYLFEDELENLLSGKVRSAFIVTPVMRPDMLTMFCSSKGIEADCIKSGMATIAILPSDSTIPPEEIAQAFDFEVLLIVNRANRIEAHEYFQGKERESYTPSIFFANYPFYLEDLAIGIETVHTLEAMGIDIFHTKDFDPNKVQQFSEKIKKLGMMNKLDDENTYIHSTDEL